MIAGRAGIRGAALAAGLIPALAWAQPNIIGITPPLTPANTGATVVISGTGFGAATDTVRFPGNPYTPVTPMSWGPGSLTVRVPSTWSGNVQLRAAASGLLSNSVNHDISYCYSGSQWPGGTATWYLNSAGAPGCTFTQTLTAVSTGFSTWACASGFTYNYGGTTAIAVVAEDGTNVIFFRSTDWDGPGTIARTFAWNDGSGNRLESDIIFNAQFYTWSCAGAPGEMDVQNIATHEEGHFLGIRDLYGPTDTEKTMYGYGSNGETSKRTLDEADVLGAEFMYPHVARADLSAGTPAGWSWPVVPRNTPDATGASALLPSELNGNATTYLNGAMANTGGDCAGPEATNRFYLDDALVSDEPWASFLGTTGAVGVAFNQPVSVKGGRHTLRWELDALDDIQESDEADNTYQKQFVWSPYVLLDQAAVPRSAPPPQGSMAYPNCDGFEFTTPDWAAVAILPVSSSDNYNLRLFDDYTGSLGGFGTPLRTSAEPAGEVDFVLVRGPLVSGDERWVGVVRSTSPPVGGFYINQSNVVGGLLTAPTLYNTWVTSPVVTMGLYQAVKVHEVAITDTSRTYTFALDNLTGSADLNLSLYYPGGPYAKTQWADVSQNGPGVPDAVDFKPPVAGNYAVVVWKRDANDFALSNTYQLRVGPALSDLRATLAPPGWFMPLIPRNAADATPFSTPFPTTLTGNADTWVNWASYQLGPNPVGALESRVWLDVDQQVAVSIWPGPSYPAAYIVNNAGPFVVRGGRHTLTHVVDPDDLVAESNESDNTETDQFVWSPLVVTRDTPVSRAAPPNPGAFTQPNCDGMQFTHTAGVAWVVSLAPTNPLDSYDLFLYDDYANTLTGFSNLRKVSSAPSDLTDFVVGHYLGTPATVYPAAVRNASTELNRYNADQNDALGRRVSGASVQYLDQNLKANRLADVYEGLFSPGQTYHIVLVRNSGPSDLAFNVYGTTAGGLYNRAEGLAMSQVMDADRDTMSFTASTFGYHPIVVYRVRGNTASSPMNYSLMWSTAQLVGVGDGLGPTELAFLGATPNPMRGPGQLAFALPARARVRLDVYDVSGRRVRELLDRECDSGRHVVGWDGAGDDGAALGPGLYWARFEANGRVIARRVTLLE